MSKAKTFIQWKSTDIMIEVYCPCGGGGYFSGWFMYFIKCTSCGQVYECGTSIELKPIDEAPKGVIINELE